MYSQSNTKSRVNLVKYWAVEYVKILRYVCHKHYDRIIQNTCFILSYNIPSQKTNKLIILFILLDNNMTGTIHIMFSYHHGLKI